MKSSILGARMFEVAETVRMFALREPIEDIPQGAARIGRRPFGGMLAPHRMRRIRADPCRGKAPEHRPRRPQGGVRSGSDASPILERLPRPAREPASTIIHRPEPGDSVQGCVPHPLPDGRTAKSKDFAARRRFPPAPATEETRAPGSSEHGLATYSSRKDQCRASCSRCGQGCLSSLH